MSKRVTWADGTIASRTVERVAQLAVRGSPHKNGRIPLRPGTCRGEPFENFGPIDGLGASSSTNPLLLPPWVVAQKTRPLQGLLDGIRDKSITDIEEAIELGRSILASSDPSDQQSSSHEFGEILFKAFEHTRNINYLNESIHTHRQLFSWRVSHQSFYASERFLRIGGL